MEAESGAVSTAGRASGPGMAGVRSNADSGPEGLKTEVEGPDAHYFVGKKRGQDAPSATAKSGPPAGPVRSCRGVRKVEPPGLGRV